MTATDLIVEDVESEPDDWRTYPDLDIPPILASALEHFQHRGYHGTSVRSIAAGVDLTMPTLYYHYGSKEGILSALLEVAMDDLHMHIDSCLADAGDDTMKVFENFITTVALHYINRRDLAMLHAEFRFLGPEFRGQYVTSRKIVESALEDVLTKGIAEGVFADDDARFTTRVVLGMLSGILDWHSGHGPLCADEIADRYMRCVTRLVTP